ncbi:unnamed protein product [Absidia cylindrospora]
MALEHHKAPYDLIHATPHSEELKKYTPFGKIPVLLVPGRSLPLIETLVIRTYIDAAYAPDTKLNPTTASLPLSPSDFESQLTVNFWISITADHVFKNLIFGIAKPRAAMELLGESEHMIKDRLKEPMGLALRTLANLNDALTKSNDYDGPFILGEQLTWADLFLFPPMADLFSLPEAEEFKNAAPKIWLWYQHFEHLDLAKSTFDGTVAQLRSLV